MKNIYIPKISTYNIVSSPAFSGAELLLELDDNIVKFYLEKDFAKNTMEKV